MRNILVYLTCLLPALSWALTPFEERMIQAGTPYFGLITWAHDTAWPTSPMRSFTAAQIQKESLWNPHAELCVPKPTCDRERGIGLGQFTITRRFNAFQEVSLLHPMLKGWAPHEYKDPRKQVLAVVVKDYAHYNQCRQLMLGTNEIMACVASSYNGGYGGFMADRRLCSNTAGCDPYKWFGNVSAVSIKAKAALPGYKNSFFDINRSYAQALVVDYRLKYVPHLGN